MFNRAVCLSRLVARPPQPGSWRTICHASFKTRHRVTLPSSPFSTISSPSLLQLKGSPRIRWLHSATNSSSAPQPGSAPEPLPPTKTIRENIYTIPNFLTVTRIAACPVLGWSIVQGDFQLAAGLVVYAGLTDLADGWIARRFNMGSVLGTILDPAADKFLMTTLTVALAMKGMLPVPLAVIILGRDVLLSLTAFYYRYISLPAPKTLKRYWDFSIPSASVHPTTISKVNTALQLVLMTATVFNPILPYNLDLPLEAFQWVVAGTTIWSGMSYVWSKNAVKILSKSAK